MPFIDYNNKNEVEIWEDVFGTSIPSEHVTFGWITLKKGAQIPIHQHRYEQWTHVIQGKLKFDVNGETKIITPGMAVQIPPNALHCAKALTRSQIIECFVISNDAQNN